MCNIYLWLKDERVLFSSKGRQSRFAFSWKCDDQCYHLKILNSIIQCHKFLSQINERNKCIIEYNNWVQCTLSLFVSLFNFLLCQSECLHFLFLQYLQSSFWKDEISTVQFLFRSVWQLVLPNFLSWIYEFSMAMFSRNFLYHFVNFRFWYWDNKWSVWSLSFLNCTILDHYWVWGSPFWQVYGVSRNVYLAALDLIQSRLPAWGLVVSRTRSACCNHEIIIIFHNLWLNCRQC